MLVLHQVPDYLCHLCLETICYTATRPPLEPSLLDFQGNCGSKARQDGDASTQGVVRGPHIRTWPGETPATAVREAPQPAFCT